MSEEESFGEEVVIDADDDGDIIIEDDGEDDEPAPSSPEEPEDTTLQDLTRKFNPQTGAARRLIYDLKEMRQSNEDELGFSTKPKGTDIFNWEVRVFGFEKGTPMFDDLIRYKKETGRGYVEMCVTFPPEYPNLPPFVRVVQPRFMFHTGHVTIGGSLCTSILTMDGWKPTYDIQSLMVNIFSAMMNGKPRIDFSNMSPYSLQEAREAYKRVANDHGWRASTWLPDK